MLKKLFGLQQHENIPKILKLRPVFLFIFMRKFMLSNIFSPLSKWFDYMPRQSVKATKQKTTSKPNWPSDRNNCEEMVSLLAQIVEMENQHALMEKKYSHTIRLLKHELHIKLGQFKKLQGDIRKMRDVGTQTKAKIQALAQMYYLAKGASTIKVNSPERKTIRYRPAQKTITNSRPSVRRSIKQDHQPTSERNRLAKQGRCLKKEMTKLQKSNLPYCLKITTSLKSLRSQNLVKKDEKFHPKLQLSVK